MSRERLIQDLIEHAAEGSVAHIQRAIDLLDTAGEQRMLVAGVTLRVLISSALPLLDEDFDDTIPIPVLIMAVAYAMAFSSGSREFLAAPPRAATLLAKGIVERLMADQRALKTA